MAKKKTRAEIEGERAQARANAARLRELAERGEARLPPEQRRPAGASNAEWLRTLATKAQAQLDERRPQDA